METCSASLALTLCLVNLDPCGNQVHAATGAHVKVIAFHIRPALGHIFFYLLDYVTLEKISKCGDWKTNKKKLSLTQNFEKSLHF